MSNQSPFLPVMSAAQIQSTIKYIVGSPFQYRTDVKTGVLKSNSGEILTRKGELIKLRPVAIHVFKAQLFNYTENDWCEIYFLNGFGAVSVMRLHGFSVQNLRTELDNCFYKNVSIAQSVLEIEFQVKNGKNGVFCICDFKFLNSGFENIEWEAIDIPNGDNIFDASTSEKIIETYYAYNYKGEYKGKITTL
jgi:hypothetical protein